MQDFIHTPPGSAPVAIYEDGGGLVETYQNKAYQYALENRVVEIHGSCRSACLLALSVPKVCVYPGAVVRAHQAYEKYTDKVRPDVTAQMLSSLPYKIKVTLEGKVQKNYTSATTLSYAELKELGVPSCTRTKVSSPKIQREQETALSQILKYFGK